MWKFQKSKFVFSCFFFFIWWGRWWLSYFNTCQSWNSSQRLRLPCLRSLYTTILFIRNYFYNRYRLDHFLSLSVLEAFLISHHLACLEDETYKAKCDGRTGIKTGFTSQCHGSKTLCWKKITTVIFEKQVLTSKALTGVYTMLSVWLVGKNCSYPALVLLQMILLLFIHWLTFFFWYNLSVPEIKAAEELVHEFFQGGKAALMEVWKPFQRMYKPDLTWQVSTYWAQPAVQLHSEVQETQSLLELHCCLLGTGC